MDSRTSSVAALDSDLDTHLSTLSVWRSAFSTAGQLGRHEDTAHLVKGALVSFSQPINGCLYSVIEQSDLTHYNVRTTRSGDAIGDGIAPLSPLRPVG